MQVVSNLREQVKNARKHIRAYPDAIVRDPYENLVPLEPRRKDNRSALGRVFGGVIEKVADDLREPRKVRIQPNGRVRQFDFELVAFRNDLRIARFDRGFE